MFCRAGYGFGKECCSYRGIQFAFSGNEGLITRAWRTMCNYFGNVASCNRMVEKLILFKYMKIMLEWPTL